MDRADSSPRQSSLWLSMVSVALIVAAVVGALAATQRLTVGIFGAPAPDALSSSLTISTDTTAGLLQPEGAYFTPDGARIGVIGEFAPCQQHTPGLTRCGHGLAIYDSHSGALIQLMPIEPLLDVTPPADSHRPTHSAGGYVHLSALGWSPDSTWFAMVYSVFDAPAPSSPDDMIDSGLLLVTPQTGATRIIRGDSGYFATLNSAPGSHPIWHISSASETVGFSEPPGVIFAWGANGLPFPTVPVKAALDDLPANAGPRYPVGEPVGAAPFTIWQPGLVIGPDSAQAGAGRSAFVTTFASWTADGAHVGDITTGLALPAPIRANSIVSAPSGTAGPTIPQPTTLPNAPARDVALARVQEAVGAYGWASVAWNHSGAALASVICFARKGQTLELRDAASGALSGSAPLRLHAGDPGCSDATDTNLRLQWSPNDTRLLVVDRSAATLTLWTISKFNQAG